MLKIKSINIIIFVLSSFVLVNCNNQAKNTKDTVTDSQAKEVPEVNKTSYTLLHKWQGDGNRVKNVMLIERNSKIFLITEYVEYPIKDLNDSTIGAEVKTTDNINYYDVDDTSQGFKILENGDFQYTSRNQDNTILKKSTN